MSLLTSLLTPISSGSLTEQGFWNASTNTPSIADGIGLQGSYYIVSVAGTQDLGSGSQTFSIGDWVYYNSASEWKIFETGVGYVPEDQANKATDFSTINNVLYPSVQAAETRIDSKISALTLGTMSAQNANAVAITGGSINGTTINNTVYAATLSGDLNLTSSSGQCLYLDPNGLDRDIIAEATPLEGRKYYLYNSGSANHLIFRNNGYTSSFNGIPAGFLGVYQYDGTDWILLFLSYPTITSDQLIGFSLLDQSLTTGSSVTFSNATISTLTASELLATNATSGLVSLPVATNPSLTEIAYVKGVTSAIQTQFGAKQNILTEGAFVDGDKTKLNGIEVSADVTDTANVTAAGALMDSEVTNLAQVKALAIGSTVQAYNLVLTELSSTTIITQSTTAKTLALTDANDYIRCTNTSDLTITIPTDASVAFPIRTQIQIIRAGTGQVTFAPISGVTINKAEGLKIAAQYKSVVLTKVSSNTWDLVGALAA